MPQHPYTMPRQHAERTDTGASGNGKTRRITITTVMLACAIACGIVQPAFIYEGMSAWHSDIGMFWSLINAVVIMVTLLIFSVFGTTSTSRSRR